MKKSDLNDIDLIFRNHFAESEVPVANRQALWNRIVGSRRRYRVIPFLFFGFLISFISYAAYSNYNKDDVEVLYNVSNSVPEFSNNHDSYALNTNVEVIDEENIEESKFESITLNNFEETNILNEPIRVTKEKIHIPASHSTLEENYLKNKRSELLASQMQNNGNKFPKTIPTEEIRIDENDIRYNLSVVTRSENLEPQQKKLELVAKFEAVPIVDVSISEIALEALTVKNTMKKCTTEGGGRFFADVYANVGIPIERVALNDAFADQLAYRDAWEQRFHTLPSLSAGISVGYESPLGISLSIGAEYQRIESEYRTIQTITERVTIYDPMAYFYYDANNEVVWVGDSVTAISSFDRTVSLGNTSNLIHIPLEVSYSLYNKAPWKVRASAAAIFNFSLNYRGQYLRSDQSLIQIDEANNDTYVSKNLGLGFEGGAYLGYQFGDNWELYFGPRFRYNNKSHWNNTEVINISRHFISLRTGLRYHF